MKTYELVHLNPKIRFKRGTDLQDAQEAINRKVAEGWTLQQVISPNDLGGSLVGVFYKEK